MLCHLYLLVSQEDKTLVDESLKFCATVLRDISSNFQGATEHAVSLEVGKPDSH